MNSHWNDQGWHHQQWEGPNGGDLNHFGYWGPNGYWGHTGYWGPNGGHWGHTFGWGPNGAYGTSRYFGPAGYWSRNWGGWYNGYAPAWGYGRWNYLWDEYPAAMAVGATMWGINAVNYAFGVSGYVNPYCDGPVYVNQQPVADYTQPIVGDPAYITADASSTTTDDGATSNEGPTPEADDPVTSAVNDARTAFHNGDYDRAIQLIDQALADAPLDAAINEFRSLCLFALGQYRESAATIHAVLAAGPGWDWTTLISLYADPDDYTQQLRKLEAAVKQAPDSADLRFLLAYHYLTGDHQDAAVAQLKKVVALEPKDQLSADLVKMYAAPPAADSSPAASSPAPDLEKPAYPLAKLQGTWTADQDGAHYSLNLKSDDEFIWEFQRDGHDQSVTGAYLVRGKNLVMQPDSGGTMLSEISLNDDQSLSFTPIGEGVKLTFQR